MYGDRSDWETQLMVRRYQLCLSLAIGLICSDPVTLQCAEFEFLKPGAVYREYAVHNGGNRDWRVTDPNATARDAHEFLPNPVLELEIEDLEHAVRAEAMLHRWGGHVGTSAKCIRFNGKVWITLPELATTPAGTQPEEYYFEDNPVVEVPLDHLQVGENTLEGTCSALAGHNWGQWGLYSLILRVYYDPDARDHPTCRIVSPQSDAILDENPTIAVEADASQGVARVDVVAQHFGYDENGDGLFYDWHGGYFQPLRGAAAELREHVGTAWREPYRVTWNTRYVPDPTEGDIWLVARVQDSRGVWSVSPFVTALQLERPDSRVVMYRATDVPERFGVRVGQEKSCRIRIPDEADLTKATDAVLALRTWHGWDGHHEPLDLNGHRFAIRGKNHHYDYDLLPVPLDSLRTGDNVFTIRSGTEHHMLEVLWPGPAVIVRYGR
jgi:hypothetical protein